MLLGFSRMERHCWKAQRATIWYSLLDFVQIAKHTVLCARTRGRVWAIPIRDSFNSGKSYKASRRDASMAKNTRISRYVSEHHDTRHSTIAICDNLIYFKQGSWSALYLFCNDDSSQWCFVGPLYLESKQNHGRKSWSSWADLPITLIQLGVCPARELLHGLRS